MTARGRGHLPFVCPRLVVLRLHFGSGRQSVLLSQSVTDQRLESTSLRFLTCRDRATQPGRRAERPAALGAAGRCPPTSPPCWGNDGLGLCTPSRGHCQDPKALASPRGACSWHWGSVWLTRKQHSGYCQPGMSQSPWEGALHAAPSRWKVTGRGQTLCHQLIFRGHLPGQRWTEDTCDGQRPRGRF